MYAHILILLHIPEQDRLLYTVYEKSSVAEGSVNPHLWTYRSRITLEHLFQTLQAQDKRKECPILYHFLTEVRLIYLTSFSDLAIIFFCPIRSLFYEPLNTSLELCSYSNRCMIAFIVNLTGKRQINPPSEISLNFLERVSSLLNNGAFVCVSDCISILFKNTRKINF